MNINERMLAYPKQLNYVLQELYLYKTNREEHNLNHVIKRLIQIQKDMNRENQT